MINLVINQNSDNGSFNICTANANINLILLQEDITGEADFNYNGKDYKMWTKEATTDNIESVLRSLILPYSDKTEVSESVAVFISGNNELNKCFSGHSKVRVSILEEDLNQNDNAVIYNEVAYLLEDKITEINNDVIKDVFKFI